MVVGDVIEIHVLRELRPDQWLPAIVESVRHDGVIAARVTGTATLPGGYKHIKLHPHDRGNTWR